MMATDLDNEEKKDDIEITALSIPKAAKTIHKLERTPQYSSVFDVMKKY